ncbi:MAG TPA: glycosyltransferase [Solirubrobacteraceae bacterium]|jgi:glycosyltransferase involved in cell wall biosynthesis
MTHGGGDGRPQRSLRTASLGISTTAICGVRDHGALLAEALAHERCPCSTHWLDRKGASLRAARRQVDAWTQRLPAELAAVRADAALLHYSVFSYAFRGLPLFVHPLLAAVRRAQLPLVTILHEFVYPWRRDGVRGTAWAISQRALLIDVMRASDSVVTTTDFQAEWLRSRPWLARRPVAIAPVFSNLPAPARARQGDRDSSVSTVGVFGYAYGPPTVSLVVQALRLLADRGVDARVELLGAPGRSSAAAQLWLSAARDAGLRHAPSFSGTLEAQQLSDALAACDALLFVDPLGPNSRKTTLAASLSSGRPVIAVDGPRRWRELADAHAAKIVEPQADALAGALAQLLDDRAAREALAARGRTFAEQSMSAARAAHTIAGLLRDVAS